MSDTLLISIPFHSNVSSISYLLPAPSLAKIPCGVCHESCHGATAQRLLQKHFKCQLDLEINSRSTDVHFQLSVLLFDSDIRKLFQILSEHLMTKSQIVTQQVKLTKFLEYRDWGPCLFHYTILTPLSNFLMEKNQLQLDST